MITFIQNEIIKLKAARKYSNARSMTKDIDTKIEQLEKMIAELKKSETRA